PEVADDLLQETFLQVHRSRAAYNPAYAVKPWVFGLARNVFLMNWRGDRRRSKVLESREDLPEIPALPAPLGIANDHSRLLERSGRGLRSMGGRPQRREWR